MSLGTIAAISTANAAGGIGIIRLSGDKSIEIAEKVFKGNIRVCEMESHTMHLGKIYCGGQATDTALICVFKAPRSYTGETVVEINCHGGLYVCRMVLDEVISAGAEPAEAGEFTRRAFLNGKMDLSQAEAVADIISAGTKNQVAVAANQLDKMLSSKIEKLRQALVDKTAHLLASIDFSEEGIEEITYDDVMNCLKTASEEIDKLLLSADDGRIIKDGINAVIIGSPNVGKSSLLNAMNGEEKAIVTDIEGTTRDVLETQISIRGIKINLFDTAGIRKTADVVEKIGVERAKKTVDEADVVFLVTDGSRSPKEYDKSLEELAPLEKTICIINKSDLPCHELSLPDFLSTVRVSAKTGEGLEELFDVIEEKFRVIDVKDRVIITNPRHKNSLAKAKGLVANVLNGFSAGMPFDILLGDIELTISALGEISGMTVSDEIIDNVFANFCVGK